GSRSPRSASSNTSLRAWPCCSQCGGTASRSRAITRSRSASSRSRSRSSPSTRCRRRASLPRRRPHREGSMSRRAVSPATLLALALVACGSTPPITSCDPVGAATPLCGFQNPEDLALLPDRRYVLVSEYGDAGERPGRISLLDLHTGEHATSFAGGVSAGPGARGAPVCGGCVAGGAGALGCALL